jgi:signal transduction histidine kinase
VQGDRRRELWSLSIRNQGNDLSPDEMNQIGAFKQFWHGSQKPQGIGLGLALVQGIARLHGCEFALHSGGSETTATILFPIEA